MPSQKNVQYHLSFSWYIWLGLLFWTGVILLSLSWQLYTNYDSTLESARIEARSSYNKDVLYRHWAAMHGGVYVPVTEDTPPNPYLDVPERDITTPSGRELTLINPAYMTRQVYEMGQDALGFSGHITSLLPIRPDNAPDAWEATALRAFETGAEEISEVMEIEGTEVMRLMRPFVTEESCLKCHAQQGYQVGDIRGGISVAVQMQPYRAVQQAIQQQLFLGHLVLWLLGVGGIALFFHKLQQTNRKEHDAQAALRESEKRFRMLAENASDLIYRIQFKPETQFEYVSPSATAITGYTPEEHYADPQLGFKLVHPDDRDILAAASHKPDEPIILRWVHKNGSVLWTEQRNTPIFDEAGNMIAMEGIARDITERKQAEESALRNYSVLQRIFDNTQFLLAYMDADFNFIQVNEAYAHADGKTPEDLIGKNHFDLYPNAENEVIFKRVVQTGESYAVAAKAFQYSHNLERGTSYWDWSLRPVTNADGQVEGVLLLLIDVTEREQATLALREAEERYRTVADFSTDWTYWQKPDGTMQYVSPACEYIIGYTPGEIQDNPAIISHAIHEADQHIWNAHRHLPTADTTSYTIQFRIYHKDGGVRWIEHTCRPIIDGHGRFDGYRVSNVDITERKRAEQELHESRQNLELIVKGTRAGTWEWNIVTGETIFNDYWAKIAGYTLDELAPISIQTWMSLTHPDDLEESNRLLQAHFAGEEEFYECEARMKHKDGHWVWVLDRGMVMKWTADHKPLWMYGTHVDITERKQAEAAMLEAQARYKLLSDLTFEGIAIHNQGVAIDVNPAFVRMFGYEREELVGKQIVEMLFTPESQTMIRQNIRIQHAQPYEVIGIRKDGTQFPIEIEARQINPQLRVASLRDVTQRKESESIALEYEGLKARFQKEQNQNALIQRIIAALSHDLRTPLTIISTSKDILDKYNDRLTAERRKQKLESIGTQVRFALELLEDTVEMARGNRGESDFDPQPINLAALCEVSLQEVQLASESNHRVRLVNNLAIETAWIDEVLVSRILLNLLSNAVKYSPEGSEIRLELDQTNEHIILRVTDQGMGIKEADLPNIFEPFYRVSAVRKTVEGTGLGLSIVKDCVERHQGAITVESVPGEGTMFTVYLPLIQARMAM